MIELSEIKKALASRAEEVCQHLLPDGKREKNDWRGGRLATGDGGHSLGVVISGEKAGIWTDHGGTAGGNNLLELWVQARGLAFQDALAEVKEWLEKRGVKPTEDLRALRKKTYQKPTVAGITRIKTKTEFYLTVDRQIPAATLKLYNVASLEDDDVIVFPYLNENKTPDEKGELKHRAQMIKYVKLARDEKGKKVSWTSKDTAKVLFGKHTRRPEDRALLICEGEIDAMTWRAVLDMLGIKGVCCVSVPFGAKWAGKDGVDPNSEWIDNDWEFIQSFERIYISGDMDEEGRKMQEALVKRLGREICFCIELPLKDANELLIKGREKELGDAFRAAKTLDPAVLKNASHFRQAVLDRLYGDNATRGIPLPFGNHPFHLRWNEWTLVTGQNGSGKTTVLNFILLYLAKLGYNSTVASLEVPTDVTLAYYVPQITGEKLPPKPVAEAALDWVEGHFWFYDIVGRGSLKEILEAFRYAYRRYGVRFFVIDSIKQLGINPEDLAAQDEAALQISEFTSECDSHVFVVAHPRKAKNEIDKIGKMDVKGSGGWSDGAHNVWVVRRNKAKEREIEKCIKFKDDEAIIANKRRTKPDAELAVEKQRNDEGDEPLIDLWFVKGCKQYFGSYRETGIALMTTEIPQPVAEAAPTNEEILEDVPF